MFQFINLLKYVSRSFNVSFFYYYYFVRILMFIIFGLLLLLLLFFGQALGACWYFFSTQRLVACWYIACENHNGCEQSSFKCDHISVRNVSLFNDFCGPKTELFKFGIFLEAIQSGIFKSTDFPQKLSTSFWWGMQNLRFLDIKPFTISIFFLYLMFAHIRD